MTDFEIHDCMSCSEMFHFQDGSFMTNIMPCLEKLVLPVAARLVASASDSLLTAFQDGKAFAKRTLGSSSGGPVHHARRLSISIFSTALINQSQFIPLSKAWNCAFSANLTAHIHNVWFNPPTDRQPSHDEQEATGCRLSVLEKAASFAEIENERSLTSNQASKQADHQHRPVSGKLHH
ncbi:hypothetical protein T11_12762 [Trichinella zimbabwensis]|uniref:Uncharacterized protein n=1 Tax=Trichinella zimbabwensis TaxID=268475 RepID=A0A0V1HYC8_9BILA|nr:hypothetical protein T11_12762 [Trichinella zimbabwensis]